MRNKFILLARQINSFRSLLCWYFIIHVSGLFDKNWYLAKNPDVAHTKTNPLLHYLHQGGFEGRDPGPNFCTSWYLDVYEDARNSRMTPLVHYLKYGKQEKRIIQPHQAISAKFRYECPVCKNRVNNFLPIPTFYVDILEKYQVLYTSADYETINAEQCICPYCGVGDRHRLYACYLDEKFKQYQADDEFLLLDIAPTYALGKFIEEFKQINRRTADLLAGDVDLVVDITSMPEIDSNSYDILICSHVLEHVSDDNKALSELYRVLKPGGWGIIMVPINLAIDHIDEDPTVADTAERWRRFGQDDHVRMYNKSGFIERIESAGFTLHQFGIEHFGESAFSKYGIERKSVLYIAEKTKKGTMGQNLTEIKLGMDVKKVKHQVSEHPSDDAIKTTPSDNSAILTVIVITYNQVDYIAKALDSVLEQETIYPYKIWLCDDCSTDGTALICEEYARKHPDKIELFPQSVNTYSNPDKIFHALTALMNVDTEYLSILEGDDAWCDKNKIQIALDILERNSQYVTFAHDTLYNDLVRNTRKSLVHEIHKAEIQNPVLFEKAPLLHTSARIHRNVIKFSEKIRAADIYIYYMYLDKGPLYYYDKIMSVSNRTGKGAWSRLSKTEARKDAFFALGALNKYFNYKYDAFFSKKMATSKRLDLLKKVAGKKLAWEIWFIYRFHSRNSYNVATIGRNTYK